LLEGYLKGVERTLRFGGWNDEEIDDMMATRPSDAAHSGLTRAEMRLSVAGNASALVSSLRDAGWSARDVAEIVDGSPTAAALVPGVKPPKKAGRAKLRDLLGTSIVPA
jgi:hypothetical protein